MTIRERLLADGYAVLPAPEPHAREAVDHWQLVTDLVGVRPEMVERQPIRPIENGRSFASTTVFTPFHTDSQDFQGAPPAVPILICKRAWLRFIR